MAKLGKYIKKNPLKSAAVGALVLGAGYVGYKGFSRSQAFKKAAIGDVNAMAAQRIGEMLPAAWQNTTWLARNILPSSFFKAATQVEDFFRSGNFTSKIFAVTDTVTDSDKFEAYFKAMWGFSFFQAVQNNLSSADVQTVYTNLKREKVNLTSSASDKKGLFMVSSKPLTVNDVAVIINGSVFGINATIPSNMVLAQSDGNSLTKGTVREGYTGKVTYKVGNQSVTVTVIADKTKVKFMTAADIARKGLKQVPVTYVKR